MHRTLPTVLALLIAAPIIIAAPSAQVADGKIVVSGLISTKGIAVIVADGTAEEVAARPAVSGEWASEGGKIVFTPKYPLKPGAKYRVHGGGESLEVTAPSAAPRKPTVLTHIYPTATELPENVLRFYLEFNQPMPRGDVYKHVTLLTAKGEKVAQPFLEIDNELWNADQTRITLLIDPGRIKKELKPRLDLGPVFEQGKKYTLVVSGKWPTLSGEPLGKDVRKSIAITAPVSDALDPKTWIVTPPGGFKGSLTINFGRPMDMPILSRTLTVIGPGGAPLSGTGEAGGFRDRAWTFRPSAPWEPGAYTLRADAVLEDVCGNRVAWPFEIDLVRPPPSEVKVGPTDIPFVVGR